jgi:hypothetical protein
MERHPPLLVETIIDHQGGGWGDLTHDLPLWVGQGPIRPPYHAAWSDTVVHMYYCVG